MDILPQAMLFMGIIPSLILLFISLKDYEGYYKEKFIFLFFIIGIIAGIFSIIIEYLTLSIAFLSIILFPILEHLIKTVILNFRRFHKKREITIYGLSLGVGFGSVFTPYYIIITTQNQPGNISTLIFAFISSLSIILLHGATGVTIGYGVYSSNLTKYFLLSIILYLPISIIYSGIINIPYLPIILFPYGIIIYWIITSKIMPLILDRNNRRNN
jgi:hypothetical protein